jgi:hypothetical protein
VTSGSNAAAYVVAYFAYVAYLAAHAAAYASSHAALVGVGWVDCRTFFTCVMCPKIVASA